MNSVIGKVVNAAAFGARRHTIMGSTVPAFGIRGFANLVEEPRITMVRKKLADGQLDANSQEVLQQMEGDGSLEKIDAFEFADVKDFKSKGWEMAARHRVDTAPFFVVENGKDTKIFTVYEKLKQEILS